MSDSNCDSCSDTGCSAKSQHNGENSEEFDERQIMTRRLCKIKHKIMVLSGKGGVGKSTIAVNLAVSLSLAGKKVGLMDIDIHGPSIPRMLHLNGSPVGIKDNCIYPVSYDINLKVMSVGLLINDPDRAVIWRGPMKYGVIKQFIRDVEWGDLDYLIVDSPPGTGDEPLSIAQLVPEADGAVIVTTPQGLAIEDVRKSVKFCETLKLPVLGVVENMSGFVCPHCNETTDIFSSGGGETMAEDMGITFLGKIPLDPQIVKASDDGTPFVSAFARSKTADVFKDVIKPLLNLPEKQPVEA